MLLRFSFFLVLLLPLESFSQLSSDDFFITRDFDFQDRPPAYLQSRKSVVIISLPKNDKHPEKRSTWKGIANQAHEVMKRVNIDVVSYYYFDDYYASTSITKAFSDEMTKRQVKYLIFINQRSVDQYYEIIVTPYNRKESLSTMKQRAWNVESPSLKLGLNTFFNQISLAKMEFDNYLINDEPEFFEVKKETRNKSLKFYTKDLKVETLYVPRFQKVVIQDSSLHDAEYLKRVDLINKNIEAKNVRLEEIMSTYPQKYIMTDSVDENKLYRAGGQFMLGRVMGVGKNVKYSLSIPTLDIDKQYTSLIDHDGMVFSKELDVDDIVYKYFIKHIYTGVIYVGDRWDADVEWDLSLKNMLINMKEEWKPKKKNN